jgi:hypothetical protein
MTSTIVTAHFGEDLQVEVYDDMSFEFLDYNLTHDQAALEFGYPETPAIELANAWVESPINIAIRHMIPYDDTRIKGLALDFAEHVLVKCDSGIRQRALLAKLIDVGRKYQSGGGYLQPGLLDAIQAAKEAVSKAYDEWKERRWPLESDYAAQAVRDALNVVWLEERRPLELYHAVALAENARIAVAYHQSHLIAPPGENFEKDATVAPSMINEFKYAEMHWQIRRFIDVMNASQAGEDWPPIEATP